MRLIMSNPQPVTEVNLNKVSFQNFKDNSNIDAYSKEELWTRSSTYTNQVWNATKVGEYGNEKVYTLQNVDPTNPAFQGLYAEAIDKGKRIKLAQGEDNNLAQQWIIRFQDDETVIQSRKFLNFVMTGMGKDEAIVLQEKEPDDGDKLKAQKWTPYEKKQTKDASLDSQQAMRAGV